MWVTSGAYLSEHEIDRAISLHGRKLTRSEEFSLLDEKIAKVIARTSDAEWWRDVAIRRVDDEVVFEMDRACARWVVRVRARGASRSAFRLATYVAYLQQCVRA